ncbi:MAG: YkgJ family cysteine cluster protein [Kofleriaceae bacterium]
MDEPVVELDHPRFKSAWQAVFTRHITEDCMTHSCAIVETHKVKLDACCQYGCDVDLFERDAILAHADKIRPVLRAEVADLPWFGTEEEEDPDYPAGRAVRTEVHGGGCLFLSHDKRGCAIHRASLEQGWSYNGVKPHICRLFPLSYGEGEIVISDDYVDYSCAQVTDGPNLYRFAREALLDAFGPELIVAMDTAEAKVLAAQPKKLAVVR